MANIITVAENLPNNIQDLSKFILVGREKLVSVRAEIRAINKLNIAENVRQQKRDEAQMLSEALLDAEVRIGELLKQIPKAQGNQYVNNATSQQCETAKPKLELAKELGFNKDHVNRFETLAANKDIVEKVKAEARENEDIPTRSRVLQLVKEKNKPKEPEQEVNPDFAYRATRSINEAISCASILQVDEERLECWINSLKDEAECNFQLMMINDAIAHLQIIKAFLTKNRR